MKNNRSCFLLFIVSLILFLMTVKAEAVIVSNALELSNAIIHANSGGDRTIDLQDGTYTLGDMLWVEADGVTVRSVSGNRNAVIIEGKGINGSVTHIFNVGGSNFTVRDVTLRKVANHAVQIRGELNADAPLISNVHILDTYEQMVKVSYNPDNTAAGSDNGVIENCLLEYSAGIGPQWYIGGIDAHNAKNWIIRDNIFKNIRSPDEAVAEHAVHFWSDSENTIVERNLIINCDRGIGFGLGNRGHRGGIIRNNMIYHDISEGFADVGIGLESVVNAQVYNNTIYQEHSYPNAIEYRFSGTTGILIANNLTNRAISERDGASGSISHNVTNAEADWFVNPSSDLHLSSAISNVVDQGRTIPGLTMDFDGDSRPQGYGIDIGADEWGSGLFSADVNFIVAYNNALVVDFSALGLYYYDGATWSRISTHNVEWLEAYNGHLAADFGSTWGLWQYDGSAWTQISTSDADNTGNTMVSYNNGLAVDFGSSGMYYYNGTSWSQLSTNNPQWLTVYNGNLAADFGATYGLYQYDGISWTQISTSDADNTGNTMVAYNNGLAVDFGSLGLWYYNGTSWSQISTNNPQWLTAYNGNLAADFGATYGLYSYNGSTWTRISTADADNTGNTMVSCNNGLAVDFGTQGLYYYNDAAWSQISTHNAELAAYNGSLVADFGNTWGLWQYDGSAWSQISIADPDN